MWDIICECLITILTGFLCALAVVTLVIVVYAMLGLL